MTESVSIHRLEITREIERYHSSSVAKFFHGKKLLCEAWYAEPNVRKISISHVWVSIEQASSVSIATGMAIEWLAAQE